MVRKFILKEIIPIFILIIGISYSFNKYIRVEYPIISHIDYVDHRYDSILNGLDKYFIEALEQKAIPGASITIVKDNNLLYRKCYGVKEFGTTDSIDIHTVFRLGSVSKSFAAVLAGIMVNESYFDWDDTVKHFLPEFELMNKDYEKQLTIKHLLSHTTGLPMHAYTVLLDENVPYERIKPLLCSIPSIAPPGKLYSYQNVAYSLIADIMKSATNKEYNELLKVKLFDSMKMKDASADYKSMVKNKNVARPHIKLKNGNWYPEKHNKRYYSVGPAAGVNASISDMTNYLLALTGGMPEILDTSLLKQLYHPNVRSYIRSRYLRNWRKLRKVYYGLGFRVFDYEGKTIIYHSGYVRGYKAEIAIVPEENIGMAVLINGASYFSSRCIPFFLNNYFSETDKTKDTTLTYNYLSDY